MLKCPNCGRKAEITKDWACRWCSYPLLSASFIKEKAQREAEAAVKTKQEEEKARREAEKTEKHAAKEAEEQTKREAIEAEKQAEEQARRKTIAAAREALKAEKQAEEKAQRDVIEAGAEIYEGQFKLVLQSLSLDVKQIRRFEGYLKQIENLKIVLSGGSQEEGIIIVVSIQKPINLTNIIGEIPVVEKVQKIDKNIIVTLKTAADNS